MKVLINNKRLVVTRVYDESYCVKGKEYIDVPDGVELDVEKQYIFEDGEFLEVNEKEDEEYFKPDDEVAYENEIIMLKKQLSDTDYITNKYYEQVIINEEITAEEFKTKYAEIFITRDNNRKRINELEKLLSEIKK